MGILEAASRSIRLSSSSCLPGGRRKKKNFLILNHSSLITLLCILQDTFSVQLSQFTSVHSLSTVVSLAYSTKSKIKRISGIPRITTVSSRERSNTDLTLALAKAYAKLERCWGRSSRSARRLQGSPWLERRAAARGARHSRTNLVSLKTSPVDVKTERPCEPSPYRFMAP